MTETAAPLDVLCVRSSDRWPSSRFRQDELGPGLSRHGVALRRFASLTGGAGRVRALIGAAGLGPPLGGRRPDLVWLQREAAPLGPAVLERLAGRFGRLPLVYDLDDAIWLPPYEGLGGRAEGRLARALRNRGKVARLIGRADHVFAGNDFLAGYARRFSDRVSVVPTVVDTDGRFRAQHDHGHGGRPVVGWTGSRSTLPYLGLVTGALAALARRHAFDLAVIADRPPAGLGVPVRFHPWSPAREIADLRAFDVGIMPLADRDWERGKCGFKLIQYMACGIPAVASDVGVNAAIVRHGVDGFVCGTEREWVEALGTLLSDPALRARMGAAARARIVAHYSVRAQAPRIAAVFRTLAGGG